MTVVKHLSTTQAAEILGVHPSRVRQLCQEHEIGSLIHDRTRVLIEQDLDRLKAILDELAGKGVGRPRKNSEI